jgi:hypothetical protein
MAVLCVVLTSRKLRKARYLSKDEAGLAEDEAGLRHGDLYSVYTVNIELPKSNKAHFEVYKGLETALDKLFFTPQQLNPKQPQVSRSSHNITFNNSRFEP